ncbi:MAG: 5-deoxy-glucuronate isomerase, partial [Chloroflexota bacterium]
MDQVAGDPSPGRVGTDLIRRARAPGPDGLIVSVDPASAGWDYTDLAIYRLTPGQHLSRVADDRERLVLVLEGYAAVGSGDLDFGVVGSRATVFDGSPAPVVLISPGDPVLLTATTDALVAVAAAPGGSVHRTAFVPPDEVLVEARGSG